MKCINILLLLAFVVSVSSIFCYSQCLTNNASCSINPTTCDAFYTTYFTGTDTVASAYKFSKHLSVIIHILLLLYLMSPFFTIFWGPMLAQIILLRLMRFIILIIRWFSDFQSLLSVFGRLMIV